MPLRPPEQLPFAAGGRSPEGRTLSINSRYLTLDGKPWFPVMGEFHYARYPANAWEQEILKMKAGGIRIVSTYVFWIHHEEIEGRFDWSGQRDLRRFVETAARDGMYVLGAGRAMEPRRGSQRRTARLAAAQEARCGETVPNIWAPSGGFTARSDASCRGCSGRTAGPSSACRSKTNTTRAARTKAKSTS